MPRLGASIAGMSAPSEESSDTRPVPGERVLRAWRTWLPFAVVIAVLLAVASLVVSLATGAPAAQSPSCPPAGDGPAVRVGPPEFTDNNLAVYVGGDLVSASAVATAEGLLVVRGNTSLATAGGAGVTVVGATGVGTGVAPTPGTTMFAVGGDLAIRPDAALELGRDDHGGGNLVVGGTVTPGAAIASHGGRVHTGVGPSAVAEFREFGETLETRSQALAGLPPTGVTTLAGRSLYFSGDGVAALQVFAVDGRTLARSTLVDFTGIPDRAAVVITVSGENVALGTGPVQDAGVRIVPGPGASRVAGRTLWNFAEARSVTITGTSPVLGSVVVPAGRASVGAPTIGRLYVGGDLLLPAVPGRRDPARHSNAGWSGVAAFACQPVREIVQ